MRLRLFAILLLAAVASLRGAPTHELLAEFERPGTHPMARLLYVPADGNYYGTTTAGGRENFGTIFKMSPGGVVTTLVSFTGTAGPAKGAAPDAGLVLGLDGALYGSALTGGSLDFGTIFKVTTAGVFTTLAEFTGLTGLVKGSVPGDLVLGSDGDFYGTTQAGGQLNFGTVFRVTPAGALTTLVEFTGTSGAQKGVAPIGALVANGGVLYGVTQNGGLLDFGTVFKYTPGAPVPFATLANFTGTSGFFKGSYPAAGLMLNSDGSLYGTAEYGGQYGFGTVFKISTGTSTQFTWVHEFADPDGSQPAGELVVGSGFEIYGTTSAGGAVGYGTVFKITTAGVHTVLASFTGATGALPGAAPRAGLAIGVGANLFGTTTAGGAGYGTVIVVGVAGGVTPLADFTTMQGWEMAGGPVSSGSDVLVPCASGGSHGAGTLLRVSATGGVTIGVAFGSPLGIEPAGALVASGADFYGMTRRGGGGNRGTFFRHTPGAATSTVANLLSSSGSKPEGPLLLAPDGNFYGVATEGGTGGKGTVFRMSSTGARTTLVAFTGTTGAVKGAHPRAPLLLGLDGNIYGVTQAGGAEDSGTVFKVTLAGAFTTLAEFPAGGPKVPLAGLALGPDGNFYGTTSAGGAADFGTVFRITPAGILTILAEFTGDSGALPGKEPAAPLLAALDGTLYGMTPRGGASSAGTIFRLPSGGPPETLFHFTGTAGPTPGSRGRDGLTFAPDGRLYGVTPEGGPRGGGTVFRVQQIGPHAGTDAPVLTTTSAILKGHAQTGGEATGVSFEYGPSAALGSISITTSEGPGVSPVAFSTTLSGLTPGQTIYFRAKAVNPSGASSGLIRSFTVPTPLAEWKMANLGDPAAPDLGDPDLDGTVTLIEYGLLLSPIAPDAAALPAPAVHLYPEGQRLSLTLQRDPARNDIVIAVQAADSVAGPWTAIATSTNGAPFTGPGYVGGDSNTAGVKSVEIRDIVNVSDAPRRYLRVVVTH